VKNIQEAGHTRIQFHETIYELDSPELVEAADLPFHAALRRVAALLGYRYLRLRTVATMPGTFSHLEGHEAPITHGEPIPIAPEGPFGEFVRPAGPETEVPVEPRMVVRVAEEPPVPAS
jgi:hypothetical protein